MKKFLLPLLLAASFAAFSNPVSPNKALRLARNFWNTQASIPADKLVWTNLSPQAGFRNLYLFAADTQGFVIVAADDCVPPILGYSTENAFTVEQMPVQLVDWLQAREREIEYCVQKGVLPTDTIRLSWQCLAKQQDLPKECVSQVPPLITTQWNQRYPYNLYAPTVNGSDCPIGCVAVAMGQLMKYWNYPSRGRGTHSYSYGGMTHSADFGNTYYDWANMCDSYYGARTQAQKEAVATLLYHCAVSVDMQFTPTGSGAVMISSSSDTNAITAVNMLRKNFRYASDMQLVHQYSNSVGAWNRRLRNELDMQRPILYNGYTPYGGGHAFLCDGYDLYGLFHYNWGWGGYCDGYYYSTNLNTGSNPEDFTDAFVDNTCFFNVHPAESFHSSLDRVYAPQYQWDTTFTLYSSYGDTARWQLLYCPDWTSLSATSGQGGGALVRLTLSFQDNNSGASRSDYVVLGQADDTLRIFVSQCACHPDEMCRLLVSTSDSARNGWEGAYLQFYSKSGYQYGTVSLNDSNAVFTIPICADSVYVAWCPGVHDSQCHYSLSNSNGFVFFEDSGAFVSPRLIADPCQAPECSLVDSFPWLEDFEDQLRYHCYPRVDADGDQRKWLLGNAAYPDQGHDGSRGAAASSSYINGVGAINPDNWIMTPPIALSDTTPSKLSWWVSAHNTYDYAEHYSVLLSTTGNDPADFDHLLFSETLTDAVYHQRFASLEAFRGDTVYLAFRHHDCTNQYWISIDDIEVSFGNPPIDTIDTTAIVTIDNSNLFSIYPNPVHDQVTLTLAPEFSAVHSAVLELYTPSGQKLLSQTLKEDALKVDVTHIPSGCYYLRLTTPTATSLRRLVVIH